MKITDLKIGDRVRFNVYAGGVCNYPSILEGNILQEEGDGYRVKVSDNFICHVKSNFIFSKLEPQTTYKEIPIEKPKSIKIDVKFTQVNVNYRRYYSNPKMSLVGNDGRINLSGLPSHLYSVFDLNKTYILEIKEKE